jgi:hypothetical protein
MFWTIFFGVLLALVVNDARRDMHKTMKGWIAEAQSRAADHNKRMNFYSDKGDTEMANMHGKNYNHWTKVAKRCRFWDWLLP